MKLFLASFLLCSFVFCQAQELPVTFQPGIISTGGEFGLTISPDSKRALWVRSGGKRDTLVIVESVFRDGQWQKPAIAGFSAGKGQWKDIDPMDYRKGDRQVQRKPFVLGYTEEFYSKELKENRVLNIYLPDGYRESDTVRYPVIYLLDGAADEDFIHIAGLVQYNNFPWIDRVPKSIVVGIANVNRRRDFTFPTTVAEDKKLWPATGGSAAFIRFIEKELQPYVESRYRTGGGRALIGQSLGGLLATQILFEKPAMFDRYIIVSPSLWWDNGSLLQRMPAFAGARDLPSTQVYIGVGKEGLTPGKNPRIMEDDAKLLMGKLNAIGHPSLKVFFDYLPAEDHATVTHPAVFNAFRLLYPVKTSR